LRLIHLNSEKSNATITLQINTELYILGWFIFQITKSVYNFRGLGCYCDVYVLLIQDLVLLMTLLNNIIFVTFIHLIHLLLCSVPCSYLA
jgi:hypothetical protein